jgi:DNA-binding LytR/AlgR family response regulator
LLGFLPYRTLSGESNGFFLDQLDYAPKVIFTTAYDKYAVTAFELGALDYLLKPFGRERLERVLRRAQAALPESTAPLLSRARESLEQTRPLSRIFVRDGSQIVPIPLASLERVQGADDYVTISTLRHCSPLCSPVLRWQWLC